MIHANLFDIDSFKTIKQKERENNNIEDKCQQLTLPNQKPIRK